MKEVEDDRILLALPYPTGLARVSSHFLDGWDE